MFYSIYSAVEKNQKKGYFVCMFSAGTIVKVLVSNIPSAGYDYRLTVPATIGTFVGVRVMNRVCVGIV